MGLFTDRRNRRSLDRLYGNARAYAFSMGAPDLIAECFAEELECEAAGGAKAEPGEAGWLAWAARNLSTCPRCSNPWALFTPCASAWECHHCPFIWDAETA